MKMRIIGLLAAVSASIIGLVFVGCSAGSGSSAAGGGSGGSGGTYSTTSNVGDYAEWTFSGSTMTANWKQIDATGAVAMTFNINASCPTFNSQYGYYTCTILPSSTCTPGNTACGATPTGSFETMEVPGVALFVHTGSGGGSSEQLHVGLLKDSNACAVNTAGDYVYSRMGLGQTELFGMYRSDSNFLAITHADFEMLASSASATPVVRYTTTDASGTGTITFGNGGCTGGVRTRTAGADTFRSMMTTGGLFVLDMPSGQGGLVSFKTGNAAALADFANKSFGGISFPDNSGPEPIAVTSGAVSGSGATAQVALTSVDVNGATQTGLSIRPGTNTTSVGTNPSFPNFTAPVSGSTYAYSVNALQATYGTPSTIPGFFRIDGVMADTGRVVMMAAKVNNKVVGFGTVYNWRQSTDINPNTGSAFGGTDKLRNTGSFIIFER